MSCERCGPIKAYGELHSVVLSAPESFVRAKLTSVLSGAGFSPEVNALGVQLLVGSTAALEQLWEALGKLAEPELRDIRVAVVEAPGDSAAQAKALFASKSARDMIDRHVNHWIYDVINENRLAVHFHALVLDGEHIFAHECLGRGIATDGALIPPGKLFSTARSLDLLFQLDRATRLTAVNSTAALNPGPDARFFINFLPTAIYDPVHCLKSTTAAVAKAGLEPAQFCFEVVESEYVVDREHLKRILAFYRERGFKVALDDMGEGNSSIMSLVELRPDYVKLDGELVRRAVESNLEGRIVREMARAANGEGIVVIAEGIETPDQLDWVHNAGIRITQGYVWHKPSARPLESVPQLRKNAA